MRNLRLICSTFLIATFLVLTSVNPVYSMDSIFIDSMYMEVDGVCVDPKNTSPTWKCDNSMLYLNNYHGGTIKIHGDALIIFANGSLNVIKSQNGYLFSVAEGNVGICVEDEGIARVILETDRIDEECISRIRNFDSLVKSGVVLVTLRKV